MRSIQLLFACAVLVLALPASAVGFPEKKILELKGGLIGYAPESSSSTEELNTAIRSGQLAAYCNNLAVEGESGWRLPTKEEIAFIKPEFGMYTAEIGTNDLAYYKGDGVYESGPGNIVYGYSDNMKPTMVGGQVVCVKPGKKVNEPKQAKEPEKKEASKALGPLLTATPPSKTSAQSKSTSAKSAPSILKELPIPAEPKVYVYRQTVPYQSSGVDDNKLSALLRLSENINTETIFSKEALIYSPPTAPAALPV